ncbi:MAG: ATP-binding cassette domain-containing protein [Synechococcus sp.]|nr:ATP-binding cassette domain-containing protein [Synechococcus sp.]
MSEAVLRARGLRRLYGAVGVREAELAIEWAESVAVVGRSGSGKSTLLAMLAGLRRPQAGTVELVLEQPLNLWGLSTADRCRLRRGELGFISQFTSLLPALTTLENLLLPGELAGRPRDAGLRTAAEEGLEALGLGHRRDVLAAQLSGGEQRRAIVARALLARPVVLLADEPTSNLDGESEAEVFALLQQLCRQAGTALLMVTHSQVLAERCDRWLLLEGGVLQTPGTPAGGRPARAPGPDALEADPVPNPGRRRVLLGTALAAAGLWGGATLGAQQLRRRTQAARRHSDQLQRLAFSGLSAELTAMERLGHERYRGTIAVENLDRLQTLYLLPLDVQLYVQQGSRWNPYAAGWSAHSRAVIQLEQPTALQFELLEVPEQYTELVPGYMHVRVDVTYAIANRPDPEAPPVERRDSFFVYLLPPTPDPQKLARNGFTAEPPLFIPMPPH